MKKHFKKYLIVVFSSVLIINIGAQSVYKIRETKDIDIAMLGTSTLHDWEMNATSTTGEAKFMFEPKSNLVSIESLSFALLVKDLKSDSEGLNKNAYKALKSDKHKDIHYKLTSSIITPQKQGYLIKSKGKLTVAGVTKVIEMSAYFVINDDESITFVGSHKLNMSDYNVTPPSFMLGTIKTGDAITLNFNVVYNKIKSDHAIINN